MDPLPTSASAIALLSKEKAMRVSAQRMLVVKNAEDDLANVDDEFKYTWHLTWNHILTNGSSWTFSEFPSQYWAYKAIKALFVGSYSIRSVTKDSEAIVMF